MTNEEKVLKKISGLWDILNKHEITHLDLAHMISAYCVEFTDEEKEVEPETVEKYTNLQCDIDDYIWDVLALLLNSKKK